MVDATVGISAHSLSASNYIAAVGYRWSVPSRMCQLSTNRFTRLSIYRTACIDRHILPSSGLCCKF